MKKWYKILKKIIVADYYFKNVKVDEIAKSIILYKPKRIWLYLNICNVEKTNNMKEVDNMWNKSKKNSYFNIIMYISVFDIFRNVYFSKI